jgi:hypothetical protein
VLDGHAQGNEVGREAGKSVFCVLNGDKERCKLLFYIKLKGGDGRTVGFAATMVQNFPGVFISNLFSTK